MLRTRFVIAAHVAIFAVLILAAFYAASARADSSPRHVRAVGLADALSPPQYIVYLGVGAHVTYARTDKGHVGENCPRTGGYFTDVSAYHWNGTALRAQRWTPDGTVTYWPNSNGRRVTFDGITFTNRTRAPVLVAGWCE